MCYHFHRLPKSSVSSCALKHKLGGLVVLGDTWVASAPKNDLDALPAKLVFRLLLRIRVEFLPERSLPVKTWPLVLRCITVFCGP